MKNTSSLAFSAMVRRVVGAARQPESEAWNQRRDTVITRGPRPLA